MIAVKCERHKPILSSHKCICQPGSCCLTAPTSSPSLQCACITGPALLVFGLFCLLLRSELAALPKAPLPGWTTVLILGTIPGRKDQITLEKPDTAAFKCKNSLVLPNHLYNIFQQELFHWECQTRDVDHWAIVWGKNNVKIRTLFLVEHSSMLYLVNSSPKYFENFSALSVALMRMTLRSSRIRSKSLTMMSKTSDWRFLSWISSKTKWLMLESVLNNKSSFRWATSRYCSCKQLLKVNENMVTDYNQKHIFKLMFVWFGLGELYFLKSNCT